MNKKIENESFQYTYSAREQEEILRIRKRYLPREEDKMTQLRRLDAQATQKANLCGIAVGTAGTLILGIGMSCCMVWADAAFVPGIIVGVLGMVLLALAYPLYVRKLNKERRRIAPEILRLSEELMK